MKTKTADFSVNIEIKEMTTEMLIFYIKDESEVLAQVIKNYDGKKKGFREYWTRTEMHAHNIEALEEELKKREKKRGNI